MSGCSHADGARAEQRLCTAGEEDGTGTNLLLVVAVALLDDQGRVLLAQRLQGKQFAGMWEFPGGKVVLHPQYEQVPCTRMGYGTDIHWHAAWCR